MKIDYLIGTRPEIIRSADIIKLLAADKSVTFRLIHTGQHFDKNMDSVFFKELGVPLPEHNLNIGAVSQGKQFANIITGLEEYYLKDKPDALIVFGDTNSSLAAAIIASKMGINIVHLEAGCREYEMDMPEEVNRRLIDHCSKILFPVSEISYKNLVKEGVPGDSFFIGDPLWTVFCNSVSKLNLNEDKYTKSLGLEKDSYVVLTTHRAKNVDDKDKLINILRPLANMKNTKVVFPVHPRTRKNIKSFNLPEEILNQLVLIDPVSYIEMLKLVTNSRFVITDSGGLQKEVFWLKKPCIVIREHTAWVEPILYGTSLLVSPEESKITEAIDYVEANYEEINKKLGYNFNPYINGDRNISKDIVEKIKNTVNQPWRDDSNYSEITLPLLPSKK